ncbi:MAG: SDR family oxidoreductase [Holophaga sp.]|jgi:NAD(P)-dependent dehydrogenase (short-subunit alcohol dehydrogenase family)
MERVGGGKGKPWWILVGGRRRLGRALADALAPDQNLVLTSSISWETEAPWVTELSKQTEVRCLRWCAENADLVPTMMADLDALGAEGIVPQVGVLVSGTFPENPFGQWAPGNLQETWLVNLTFPLLAAQAVAPRLAEGGCLQFLLDIAFQRPFLKRLPYSAAKAALATLVPGLARQLAPRVRVVGHALGTVLLSPQDDAAWLARRSLLQRTGTPEDLARALRFAADSPYLTGAILTLDGGTRLI